MRTRTALPAFLLALAAAAVGCSSDSTDDKPAAATSAPAASVTPDQAAAQQACVDAVLAAVEAGTDDTRPEECASLSDSDYADVYMDGLQQHNQEGRDALQDLIDEASASAQP